MNIEILSQEDAESAAALDLACDGAAHWSAGDYRLIAAEAAAGGPRWPLISRQAGGAPARPIVALLVASLAADEVEILNLAVAPALRRSGAATALLDAALTQARSEGARAAWLEVRESNAAARSFYAARGFTARGRRRGYYPRGGGREDALTLARRLP